MGKRKLINWLGLLGTVSFLSYLAAVVFSPLDYPGYDWKSMAVSDLSAMDAPSLALWNRLSSLYGVCGIVCVMAVCVAIEGKFNKTLRTGVYTFAAMEWVSSVGYSMFPLSSGGMSGATFQDAMHIIVTAAVVVLSIASLLLIQIGGYQKKQFTSLAICATVAMVFMFVGAIGVNLAPGEYFGVFQRFSNVISVNGFNMALGLFLFSGKLNAIYT